MPRPTESRDFVLVGMAEASTTNERHAYMLESPPSYDLASMNRALLRKPVLGRTTPGLGEGLEVLLCSDHERRTDCARLPGPSRSVTNAPNPAHACALRAPPPAVVMLTEEGGYMSSAMLDAPDARWIECGALGAMAAASPKSTPSPPHLRNHPKGERVSGDSILACTPGEQWDLEMGGNPGRV